MSIRVEDLPNFDFSDVADTSVRLPPVSPGEMLMEEFMIPLGISQYRLAKEIGVPPRRINEIVQNKRAITADTDLRLCRFFGMTDGWWLRLQVAHDTAVAREKLADQLSRIKQWSSISAA